MNERLSVRARAALELAELEARRLGHHHLGTEHLLLGLLSEGDTEQSKALKAAGVTLDGAREKVAEAVGMNVEAREDGELALTARAKRAIERASRFSLQRLDAHVETEHLLLGVLDVEGTACQVLRGLGVDVAGFRRSVDTGVVDAPGEAEVAGMSPRCPKCEEVLGTVLNHRVLTATDEAGVRREFVIAFCSACGCTLGASPRVGSKPTRSRGSREE